MRKPSSPAPAEGEPGNLGEFADGTKDFKEQIVDPLGSTISVGNSYPQMANGLGLAGGALIGIHGLHSVIEGVKQNDTPTVISGAAEMTTSAVTLATLGILGGAMVLRPVGASLFLARGAHKLHSPDRADNLDGVSDVLNAATIVSNVVKGTTPLTMGLGAAGAAIGMLHGLHQIHEGARLNNPSLRIAGTGEIATSAGVALMATGLAVAPGVALAFAGAGLAVLQRIPRLRPDVNAFVDRADRVLLPVSDHTEKFLGTAARVLAPPTHALGEAAGALHHAAAPVLDPVEAAGGRLKADLMRHAAGAIRAVSKTRLFHAADDAFGAVEKKLLPAPAAGDTLTPAPTAPPPPPA